MLTFNLISLFFLYYQWPKFEFKFIKFFSSKKITPFFLPGPLFVCWFNTGSSYQFYGLCKTPFSFFTWDTLKHSPIYLEQAGTQLIEEFYYGKSFTLEELGKGNLFSNGVWYALSTADSGFKYTISSTWNALYFGCGVYNVLRYRWPALYRLNEEHTRIATLNCFLFFMNLLLLTPYLFMFLLNVSYTCAFSLTCFLFYPYALFLGRYTQIFTICSICSFFPVMRGVDIYFTVIDWLAIPYNPWYSLKVSNVLYWAYYLYYFYIWYLITPKNERDVFYVTVPAVSTLYFGKVIFDVL